MRGTSVLDAIQDRFYQIEKASPNDRRSTKSRSSRFWKRSNEMAQGMQNTLRNMYKTYGKYAGNGTKMNENHCPEASKEQVGGRTQCAKQRLKYLQNVPKIIENCGLEGLRIEVFGFFLACLARFGQNFRRSWAPDVRSWGQDGSKLGPRWSIMALRWAS